VVTDTFFAQDGSVSIKDHRRRRPWRTRGTEPIRFRSSISHLLHWCFKQFFQGRTNYLLLCDDILLYWETWI